MAVTTYAGWIADGKPAKPAQPVADMMATFARHGYTVYWYPDQRHQLANPPEDHDPYSHTAWPGRQPYPYVLALDLMPKRGTDARALTPIARQIIADKRAGRAPWVKYLNWTDEDGKVHHTKWQPNESTTSSTDSGHVHISIRTDYVTSNAAAGWDPITGHGTGPSGDDDMQQTDKLIRPTGFPDRVVGDVNADLENLRNWEYSSAADALAASEAASALDAAGKPVPTDGSLPGRLVDPPRVGSAAYTMLKAAQAASGGVDQAALDAAVTSALARALVDPTVIAAIAAALSAATPPATPPTPPPVAVPAPGPGE